METFSVGQRVIIVDPLYGESRLRQKRGRVVETTANGSLWVVLDGCEEREYLLAEECEPE